VLSFFKAVTGFIGFLFFLTAAGFFDVVAAGYCELAAWSPLSGCEASPNLTCRRGSTLACEGGEDWSIFTPNPAWQESTCRYNQVLIYGYFVDEYCCYGGSRPEGCAGEVDCCSEAEIKTIDAPANGAVFPLGQTVTITGRFHPNAYCEGAYNREDQVKLYAGTTFLGNALLNGGNWTAFDIGDFTFDWVPASAGTYDLYFKCDPGNVQPAYDCESNHVAITVNPAPTATPTPPACFVAGTKISTPQGDQPIETLHPGDQVISFHPLTHQLVTNTVSAVLTSTTTQYYLITTASGRQLRLTADHSVYVGGGK
jgi:hypothetical protein